MLDACWKWVGVQKIKTVLVITMKKKIKDLSEGSELFNAEVSSGS